MYRRDCKEIEEYALSSPAGLVDVIEFTLCSIQAGLSTIKLQRKDIAKVGFPSRFLWGKKREGLQYAMKHRERLWSKLVALRETSYDEVETVCDAVDLLETVPNLGLAKASFVAQMLGFNVACLDSHNLKRAGKTSAFTSLPKTLKPKTRRKKIVRYVTFCQERGSEYWWNTWCEYVAGNKANRDLDTGDLVSRYHVQAVKM